MTEHRPSNALADKVHELCLKVSRLEERDTNNTGVLHRLGMQMEELSNSVIKLRITIGSAIGAATVIMPILTWVLPKLFGHIWP